MNITYEKFKSGQVSIQFSGDMTENNCEKIASIIDDMVCVLAGGDVKLDMSEVFLLEPTGVEAIYYLFNRLESQNRSLDIIGLNSQPSEALSPLKLAS